MPRGERYNPYQLPFDFNAQPLERQLHVRVIREPHVVHRPDDAADYLINQVYVPFDKFKQEHLYVLLLDNRFTITHDILIYKGTVNMIQARTAELFMEAVKQNAPNIILSHCHPSGVADASPEDVHLTGLAHEAGQLLNINLLDHILVGRNQWLSFRDKGLGFPQQDSYVPSP